MTNRLRGRISASLNRQPRRKSREPAAIVACAVAMAAVLAFHPPSSATSSPLVLAGVLVALASCAWLLASVLAVFSAVNRGFVGLDDAPRRRLLAHLEAGAPTRTQPREGLA